MFMAQEDTLTIREAADAIGVSDRSLRRWIAAGLLRAEGSGRKRRVRLSDAQALRPPEYGPSRLQKQGEVAELRGRCKELRDQVRRLEHALAEERRRNGWLSAQSGRAA
jgi:excisionase family DNA binding protein